MVDFKKDIKDYYAREVKVIEDLDVDELNGAMNCLLEHYEKDATIYVFGNGGSSATASHMPNYDVKVSATFKVDPDAANKVTITSTYDADEYIVTLSTSETTFTDNPFTVSKNTSLYLSVSDQYGDNFHVTVTVGTNVVVNTNAKVDEESGEYTFGQSFKATDNTTIVVGAAQ